MSKDFRHGFTDLDDRLIEEANPYTENESVSAAVGDNNKLKRSLVRLRVLSGLAAAVVIVAIGIVAAKNGWFKKLKPSDQKPVATPSASASTPTPTEMQYKNTPTPTMPIETTPTPTMPVETTPTPTMQVGTPTPTISPRQNPRPTPLALIEKEIPDNARELTLSEIKQSDWFACLPENTAQVLAYWIHRNEYGPENEDDYVYEPKPVSAYAYEDETGPCVLLRMADSSDHLINDYIITPDGIKLNWDLREEDEVYEYDSEVYITIRNVKDVPQYELRKIKASETERYDITGYTWPFDATLPENLCLTLEHPIMDESEVSTEVIKLRTCAVKDCFPRKMVVTLGIVEGDYLLDYEFCGIEFAEALQVFGDMEGYYDYSYGSFSRNPDGTWPIYYPGWYVDSDTYEIEYGLTDDTDDEPEGWD